MTMCSLCQNDPLIYLSYTISAEITPNGFIGAELNQGESFVIPSVFLFVLVGHDVRGGHELD